MTDLRHLLSKLEAEALQDIADAINSSVSASVLGSARDRFLQDHEAEGAARAVLEALKAREQQDG